MQSQLFGRRWGRPAGGRQNTKNRRAPLTMGGDRAHRLLFIALSICLAGFLAVAAKVAPSPDRTHLTVGIGPRVAEPQRGPISAPVQVPVAPPPRAERPIQ